jgi:hypothetical protein
LFAEEYGSTKPTLLEPSVTRSFNTEGGFKNFGANVMKPTLLLQQSAADFGAWVNNHENMSMIIPVQQDPVVPFSRRFFHEQN